MNTDLTIDKLKSLRREFLHVDGSVAFAGFPYDEAVAFIEAAMQREAKHISALKIAKALTKKYLIRINFDGLNDREITELREVHYQTEEALRSEYTDA